MHSSTPRLRDAQSGSGEPQSQHTLLPGTRRSRSMGLFGEAALAKSLLLLCGVRLPVEPCTGNGSVGCGFCNSSCNNFAMLVL